MMLEARSHLGDGVLVALLRNLGQRLDGGGTVQRELRAVGKAARKRRCTARASASATSSGSTKGTPPPFTPPDPVAVAVVSVIEGARALAKGQKCVGRAVTLNMVPARPDIAADKPPGMESPEYEAFMARTGNGAVSVSFLQKRTTQALLTWMWTVAKGCLCVIALSRAVVRVQ